MQKKDTTLIIVVLLLVAGLYLLAPQKRRESGSAENSSVKQRTYSPPVDAAAIEKKIVMQMKLGRQSEELRRELMALENKMQAPKVNLNNIDPRELDTNEPIPLKLTGEDDATRVYRETIEQKRDDRTITPDQRITNKINRDEWEREYREAYEREYIRQYIENARRAGYGVSLNSRGEIINVVPVDTDEALRFPQSVDQSGENATPRGQK